MKLVLAMFGLWAGCYSPTFTACEVTCGSDSPCPDDYACGSDGFCRSSGDSTACSATLTVTTNDQGDGHVSSQPQGIDCSTHDGRPSTVTWPLGTHVSLQSQHGGTTAFSRWTGDACDDSQNPTCTFTLAGPMMITAVFR
jgi:hypothetical protein